MDGSTDGREEKNTVFNITHNEQKDPNFIGAKNWLNNDSPKTLSEYSLCSMYNVDDTGLYFGALLHSIYCTYLYLQIFKKEGAKGKKNQKNM